MVKQPNTPIRLLAFVRPEGDNGPILAWDGSPGFGEDLAMAGWDIADHEMPATDGVLYGLLIFEGWTEWSSQPEPDMRLAGEWRRLTHWETCRVRNGLLPW